MKTSQVCPICGTGGMDFSHNRKTNQSKFTCAGVSMHKFHVTSKNGRVVLLRNGTVYKMSISV